MNRLILTVPVIALLAACGASGSSPTPKVSIGGQVIVKDVALSLHNCKPKWASASDDVAKGSPITIYNAAGTIVATTTLGTAVPSGSSFIDDGCAYSWDAQVPASDFYSIQVNSHNKVTTTRAKAAADEATLTFDAN